MPFCRKCGRRLSPYSESCSDCGTSTTAAIIKVKKPANAHTYKVASKTKVAKIVVPTAEKSVLVKSFTSARPVIASKPVKVVAPSEPIKATAPTKSFKTAAATKTEVPAKPTSQPTTAKPPEEPPKHEIKQSSLSLEEDIITNPRDYETQTFDFDLGCVHDHFFPAGSTLPVSKGKAYCPICGEQLRKNEHRKRRRYHES